MANAEAYKVLVDTSIPRPIRQIDELHDGTPIYETEARAYRAGDYVLAKDVTPQFREAVSNGEVEGVLEEADLDEANEALNRSEYGVFAPEHEAERQVLVQAGHDVVSREVVLQLNSAGADTASEALEAAKGEGADERPNLTSPRTPDLAKSSQDGTTIVPEDEGTVEVEVEGATIPENVQSTHVLQVAEVRAAQNSETGSKPARRAAKRKSKSESKSESSSGSAQEKKD